MEDYKECTCPGIGYRYAGLGPGCTKKYRAGFFASPPPPGTGCLGQYAVNAFTVCTIRSKSLGGEWVYWAVCEGVQTSSGESLYGNLKSAGYLTDTKI